MITPLLSRLKAVVRFLGDSKRRRVVATAVAMLAAHLTGKAIDGDSLALTLDMIVGMGGALLEPTAPAEDAAESGE